MDVATRLLCRGVEEVLPRLHGRRSPCCRTRSPSYPIPWGPSGRCPGPMAGRVLLRDVLEVGDPSQIVLEQLGLNHLRNEDPGGYDDVVARGAFCCDQLRNHLFVRVVEATSWAPNSSVNRSITFGSSYSAQVIHVDLVFTTGPVDAVGVPPGRWVSSSPLHAASSTRRRSAVAPARKSRRETCCRRMWCEDADDLVAHRSVIACSSSCRTWQPPLFPRRGQRGRTQPALR